MKTRKAWPTILWAVALLAGTLPLVGCDDDDDDFDHDPPAGMGCIIVNNKTFDDIDVFINGSELKRVDDRDWEAYDLEPGVYRVFLNSHDNHRSDSRDVDVFENRRSMMDVTEGWNDGFDIYIYLD